MNSRIYRRRPCPVPPEDLLYPAGSALGARDAGTLVARSPAAIACPAESGVDFRLRGQGDQHLAKGYRDHADWREPVAGRHPEASSDAAGSPVGPDNLVRIAQTKAVPRNIAEVRRMLSMARTSLAHAQLSALSPQGRSTNAHIGLATNYARYGSFPRRRESSRQMDSRLRGSDECCFPVNNERRACGSLGSPALTSAGCRRPIRRRRLTAVSPAPDSACRTMNLESRIYVAGHRGMVGAAIIRALQAKGYTNLVTHTHAELDLTNQGRRPRLLPERAHRPGLSRCRQGGRHPRQQHLPRRIHLPEPGHPDQRDP